jgi:hypothetical protein
MVGDGAAVAAECATEFLGGAAAAFAGGAVLVGAGSLVVGANVGPETAVVGGATAEVDVHAVAVSNSAPVPSTDLRILNFVMTDPHSCRTANRDGSLTQAMTREPARGCTRPGGVL